MKLIQLSKAKIEGQPGAIPDLSGYGGTSISSTTQGNTTANSVSEGKRGQVIPIPIPQASSGGGGSESGGEQGGGSTTETIIINPLNSFVAKTLLMELEYIMTRAASDPSEYDEIIIESNDGSRRLDLRLGVQSIDYYEDVFSPTITAKMVVTTTGNVIDNKGIYQGLPLRGGERVSLRVLSNAGNPNLDFSKKIITCMFLVLLML